MSVEGRYVVQRARGFTSRLWRVRAQVTDVKTGEVIELPSAALAGKLCELLPRADAGELPELPLEGSPFARYETDPAKDGWLYLRRGEGALDDEAFARTKSADLAHRVVDALNRANPRELADFSGPVNARWF